MLFGIGDGGAGPGYEHIERMERFRNIEGEPEVIPSKAIDAFQKLDDGTVYPVHQGELYLEKHQGTYTTQSANKFYNRKCEFALRNYELLMLLAGGKTALPLSPERLDALWKEILLYQFHDILPGSSINRVYDESQARYQAIYSEVTRRLPRFPPLFLAADSLTLTPLPIRSQSRSMASGIRLKFHPSASSQGRS